MLSIKTQAQFVEEVLDSDRPVLVDFTAEWCGPCKKMTPTLASIEAELAGKIKVVTVDIDEVTWLAKLMGVRGIPNLMFFSEGEFKDGLLGLHSRAAIRQAVQTVTGL